MSGRISYFLSISLLICTLLLTACSVTNLQTMPTLDIAKGVKYSLVPFDNQVDDLMLAQQLTVEYQGQSHQLLVYSEFKARQLTMVATSLTGISLFELVWDYVNKTSQALTVNKSALVTDIKPRYMLADFQLVNLTAEQLRANLPELMISEVKHTGTKVRQFRQHGEILILIKYKTDGATIFEHHQRGYKITINNLAESS